jgi:heme/copper-type cytochrome/quinol oxidase subunit 2
MNYTVRVVPEDEYEAWLDDQAGEGETAGGGG